MKSVIMIVLAGYVSLALGQEANQPPPLKKRAVALGYTGSTLGFDVPRDGDDDVNLGGFGALGRADLRGHFGVQAGFALKDGDFDDGGEIDLTQVGVHAYYGWEFITNPVRRDVLRLYTKLGVSLTDMEESVPSSERLSDSAVGPSFGLGVEFGGPKWGLLFDAAWTFVDVELIPGEEESLDVGAGFLGIFYRF